MRCHRDSDRRTLRLAVERIHQFGESGGPHPDDRRPRSEPLGLKLRTPSGLFLPVTAKVRHGTPPRLLVTDIVCWHFPGPGNPPEVETDLSPLPPTATAQTTTRIG